MFGLPLLFAFFNKSGRALFHLHDLLSEGLVSLNLLLCEHVISFGKDSDTS